MDPHHQLVQGKDELSCAITTHTGQCATTAGIRLMQELCVDSLVSPLTVRHCSTIVAIHY